MPVLDDCIAGIFTPGNIGASSGQTPVEPVVPSLLPTPPEFLSSATDSIDENLQLSFTITMDKTCTFALTGGADVGQFELSSPGPAASTTLRWVFDGTQDFETPADANSDNVYTVTVLVADLAGLINSQNIAITVNDVPGTETGSDDDELLLLLL